jgi:hypothetical protein
MIILHKLLHDHMLYLILFADFFGGFFFFGKGRFCHKFSYFENNHKKSKFYYKFVKSQHTLLQYEMGLKIFYFHILSISKIG